MCQSETDITTTEDLLGPRPPIPASRTVPGLLDELANGYPSREFVIGSRNRYSYAKFRQAVRSFARGLHEIGVRPSDKVAILMGNRPEWLIADFAIMALGAVMVSINTWASRRELAYMLAHSDTSVLVCTDRFLGSNYLEMLKDIGQVGLLRQVVRVAPGDEELPGSVSWDQVMEAGAAVPETVLESIQTDIRPTDQACLLYTSGSTSTPKGVLLQHFALIENMWSIGERMHLRVGDRLWLAVSLFWGLGCENALFALMTHGGTIVLQEHFDAEEAINLIEQERCTVIYATPNMVRAIVDHPACDRSRLASLRTGITIGTPEQVQLLADLGPREVCNVYGLTETYGNCTVTDADLPLEVRANCMGAPLDNVEILIEDIDSGEPLPAGQTGEIKVRGYVTCGYYKDEDKNMETFDDAGFFLTGDLGFLDEHGRLHYRGRRKEMIKTGGINVAPVEVEEVLMSHAGVDQAFVIGLPDPRRDEVVAAVVVPATTFRVDEDALRAHCEVELAAYKRPRRYRLLSAEQLPLTSTGKVNKTAMPALFGMG